MSVMPVTVITVPVSMRDAAVTPRLFAVLDRAERERAAGFVSQLDALLYMAAHALARFALSAVSREDRVSWSFDRDVTGKPFARSASGKPGPAFSLSHARGSQRSGDLGVVGVAVAGGPTGLVGFDVEGQDPTLNMVELPRVLTPREAAAIRALPGTERPAALTRLWTLKEAFAKATGLAIGADLSGIGFDCFGPDVRVEQALGQTAGEWSFEQRSLAGGFSAALAVCPPAAMALDRRWREMTAAELARGLG